MPVEDLVPATRFLVPDLQAFEHLAACVGRDVRFDEGADLVAEGQFLPGEAQVHGKARPPWLLRFAVRNYISCRVCRLARGKRSGQARRTASSSPHSAAGSMCCAVLDPATAGSPIVRSPPGRGWPGRPSPGSPTP